MIRSDIPCAMLILSNARLNWVTFFCYRNGQPLAAKQVFTVLYLLTAELFKGLLTHLTFLYSAKEQSGDWLVYKKAAARSHCDFWKAAMLLLRLLHILLKGASGVALLCVLNKLQQ